MGPSGYKRDLRISHNPGPGRDSCLRTRMGPCFTRSGIPCAGGQASTYPPASWEPARGGRPPPIPRCGSGWPRRSPAPPPPRSFPWQRSPAGPALRRSSCRPSRSRPRSAPAALPRRFEGRLLQDAVQRARREVVRELARNSDAPRLDQVLVLPVTSPRGNLVLAVRLDQANGITNLHAQSRSA